MPALNDISGNGCDDFLGSARERLFGFITAAGLSKRQVDENEVFNLAAGQPEACGSVGVDVNCAVIGYTARARTAPGSRQGERHNGRPEPRGFCGSGQAT